jgi:hypothetical protein
VPTTTITSRRRRTTIAGVTTALVLVLASCTSEQLGDRGGDDAPPDRVDDVDRVEVYRNVDGFPNVARVCVRGRGFAATASGNEASDTVDAGPALVRVVEWDDYCAGFATGP